MYSFIALNHTKKIRNVNTNNYIMVTTNIEAIIFTFKGLMITYVNNIINICLWIQLNFSHTVQMLDIHFLCGFTIKLNLTLSQRYKLNMLYF